MIALKAPSQEIDLARVAVRRFAIDWYGETPIRLHEPRQVGEDGAPRLHPDFVGYLEDGLYDRLAAFRSSKSRMVEIEHPRRRITKAFRLLRRKAPKEFDVMYCMVRLDQVGRDMRADETERLEREFAASVRRTRQRLNQRAATRGDPLVSEDEILVLVVSAVRKLALWSG